MRLEIPPDLETWLNHYAKRYACTPAEAGARLLADLETAMSEGPWPTFLARPWSRLARELHREGIPSPSSGLPMAPAPQPEPTAEEAPSEVIRPLTGDTTPAELTPEQLSLLERSSKLASGFASVYASNGGWRARVRDPEGTAKLLPTRRKPALAAWDRYQFFVEHKMPYGELGTTIDWLRQRMPNATEEELRREAEEMEGLKAGSLPGE